MQAQVFQGIISSCYGIMIPFLGTAFGSAGVLFMKNKLASLLQRALTGFSPDIHRHDMQHEELLICYPERWAEEVRKCCRVSRS